MLLTEIDHPGDVFRVALCGHLPGLEVGGVGGDDDGDDGEFLAAVWASCDAVSRCNGVRQAVTEVDDVEDVVDVVVTAFATVVADAVVGAMCLPGCFSAARLASTRIGSGAHRAIGLRAHGLSADAGPARASRPLRLFSIAARITRHAPPSPAATGCPRPLETPAHRGVDQAQRTTGTDLTADKPAPTRRKASTRVTTGPAPPDDTGRPRHGPTQTNPKPLRPTRRLRERPRPELTLTQILRNPHAS